MKKVTLILGAALISLVMASCGAEKAVTTNTANTTNTNTNYEEEPCYEYLSTPDVYYGVGQHVAGSDRQIQFAYDQAANNARADLAAQLENHVKSTNEKYANEYGNESGADQTERINQLTTNSVNRTLRMARIVCRRSIPGSEAGSRRCFVAVEFEVKQLLDDIVATVSNDEKLRIDFEYEKYKKIFDEEMANYKQ